MADIVGTISSQTPPTITEAPAWVEPCRILILSDGHGRRHGRVEWLESEVDEAFLQDLAVLCTNAMRDRRTAKQSPSAAS